jgi:CRP/FNR family transcriptional regulator, cyclic AMP receptor protein
MAASAAESLRHVDLFAGLSQRALDKVAARTRTVEHAAGKEIATQGESGLGFHLILEGNVDVLVNGAVVTSMAAGRYFGDISLIDGKPRSATIVTTSPVTTLSLVTWDFTPLLDEEPELTKALLLVMCARLRAAESR